MAVTFAHGFKAAGVAAGIKKSGARDVMVVFSENSEQPVAAAMVGTQNQVCAPSVTRNRALLPPGKGGFVQGIVVNAGCANVATGPEGVQNNLLMAGADNLNDLNVFLTASTGVIGVQLPMDKLLKGIESAKLELSSSIEAGQDASEAIMTTDLVPKFYTKENRNRGANSTYRRNCKGFRDDCPKHGNYARLYHHGYCHHAPCFGRRTT